MKNAFNECSHTAFLNHVYKDFPERSREVYWCYNQPARLHFGHHHILASTGVQLGNPLGPLLFSSVLIQFHGSNPLSATSLLSLRYLNDGTFTGSRSSLLVLLSCCTHSGPSFSLHINLSKCELYWPSGDRSFLNFLKQSNTLIQRAVVWSYWGLLYGVLLLFFEFFLFKRLHPLRKNLQILVILELNCICSGAVSAAFVRSHLSVTAKG